MKKQIIGKACPLCKERYYKEGSISEEQLKVDKLYSNIHMVGELPKFCSKCGGYLKIIKKYIISSK